jgi:hypothetical protein
VRSKHFKLEKNEHPQRVRKDLAEDDVAHQPFEPIAEAAPGKRRENS